MYRESIAPSIIVTKRGRSQNWQPKLLAAGDNDETGVEIGTLREDYTHFLNISLAER